MYFPCRIQLGRILQRNVCQLTMNTSIILICGGRYRWVEKHRNNWRHSCNKNCYGLVDQTRWPTTIKLLQSGGTGRHNSYTDVGDSTCNRDGGCQRQWSTLLYLTCFTPPDNWLLVQSDVDFDVDFDDNPKCAWRESKGIDAEGYSYFNNSCVRARCIMCSHHTQCHWLWTLSAPMC